MVAQTIEPRTLAPWWNEEKCHAHQPWETRRAAERAADLHPISFVSCSKCAVGMVIEVFRCHSDPTHFHIGHNLARAEEVAVQVTTSTPRRNTAPKHSRETARWIYTMRGAVSSLEAARRSGASRRTVRGIWDGSLYAWATDDMRTTPQEAPVQITTPPTILDSSAANGTLKMIDTAQVETPSTLVTDLADAAEWLLEQQETIAAPRFVITAIRTLIAQARSAAS